MDETIAKASVNTCPNDTTIQLYQSCPLVVLTSNPPLCSIIKILFYHIHYSNFCFNDAFFSISIFITNFNRIFFGTVFLNLRPKHS